MVDTLRLLCAVSRHSSHNRAESAVGFGLFPDRPDFLIGEDADAGLGLGALPLHAAHDRRRVVVMARGVPIHNGAHDVEHIVGLPRTVIVLDVIEQGGHIAPADAEKFSFLPSGKDMHPQQAG